ncbi:hypothetical protein DRN73_03815 [Candidatus Pacearchaeota archaeon]|nr:MAG: hypothetical protein DRN73_03815 [Candidatus Pacearchaeota archaeon]
MIKIYLISIILGFAVGFLTNWLAILSLFRPRKKILGFQGLIPRYKREIGMKISENAHLIMPSSFKKVLNIPFIGKKIDTFFKDSVASEIAKMPDEELEKIVKNVTSTELKFIEFVGGVIGMLVGLLQAVLISLVV